MMLDVGSILMTPPEKTYIRQSYRFSEWHIPFGDIDHNEKLLFIKKSFLDEYKQTLIWIELMRDAFPRRVVEDATRIAFDLKPTGLLNRCKPSFYGMLCLYLSSMFHNFDFQGNFDEIIKLRTDGRIYMFGLKSKGIRTADKHLKILKRYSKMALDLMPDKFERLKKMHDKLEELK